MKKGRNKTVAEEKKEQGLPQEEPPREEPPREEPAEETAKAAPEADPQVERLTAENQALQDKYMRLAAEYDNFRKRSQKERESLFADARSDAVTAMLPVYDNLERAMKQPCGDEAYAEGVRMILRQLEETLAKLGVTEIETEGVPFDPNKHNAVMHVDDPALGENVVAEVFQKGFMIGDKVVRFAMVKVAN